MVDSESWHPEFQEKIVGVLAASSRPLPTNEIAEILLEPRHRVLRSLSRLRELKRIEGNQAKARGSWVWWLPASLTSANEPTARQVLESVALHLREDLGLTILDSRYGRIPVLMSDGMVFYDHLAYEIREGLRRPFLLVKVGRGAPSSADLDIAAGACRLLGTKAFLWTDGRQVWTWFHLDPRKQHMRKLSSLGGILPAKPRANFAPFADLAELRRCITRCHDIIRGEEGLDPGGSFEELTKALFAKLVDELELEAGSKHETEFASGDNRDPDKVAAKIHDLFARAKESFPEVFESLPPELEKIRLRPETLLGLARALQGYSLRQTSIDVKGTAFELMVKDTFTGRGLGQFFTPHDVVQFMVDMVQPSADDVILDPACGSGGFLIECTRHVARVSGSDSLTSFVHQGVYGIDISPRMSWVTKMNMVMHGDGRSHVKCSNGLSEAFAPVNQSRLGRSEGVSLILTNPPFGAKVTNPQLLNSFETGKGRRSRNVEVLFVELCIRLAALGGRIGIVIPDGILQNPSESDLRALILRETVVEAIIDLPDETFQPFGSSASSSILFLRKGRGQPEHESAFVALARNVGFDRNGESTGHSDLPRIAQLFHKKRGVSVGDSQVVSVSPTAFLVPLSSLKDRMDASALRPSETQLGLVLRQSTDFVPLSRHAEVVREGVSPSTQPESEFRYVGLAQVESQTGAWRAERLKGSAVRSTCLRFRKGDILYGRLRPNLRKVVLVDKLEDGICSAEFYVLRPKDPELARPLAALLRSDAAYLQFSHLVTGIGRPRVSRQTLLGVRVPRDPRSLRDLGEMAAGNQSRALKLQMTAEKALERAEIAMAEGNAALVGAVIRLARDGTVPPEST